MHIGGKFMAWEYVYGDRKKLDKYPEYRKFDSRYFLLDESIDFNSNGYITLNYNSRQNNDGQMDIKRRHVRLYYSYEGMGLKALFGTAKGKIKSMDDPSAKDKPKTQSQAANYTINLKKDQMDSVIEKIESYNSSTYSLFSNNRIDFLTQIANEVYESFDFLDSNNWCHERNLAIGMRYAYQSSNIKQHGLFKYLKGDMSNTLAIMNSEYMTHVRNQVYQKQHPEDINRYYNNPQNPIDGEPIIGINNTGRSIWFKENEPVYFVDSWIKDKAREKSNNMN